MLAFLITTLSTNFDNFHESPGKSCEHSGNDPLLPVDGIGLLQPTVQSLNVKSLSTQYTYRLSEVSQPAETLCAGSYTKPHMSPAPPNMTPRQFLELLGCGKVQHDTGDAKA